MTPIVVPAAAPPASAAGARTAAAPLPSQPAPVALAAPAMVAGVERAEAVRPPDALLRSMRPELLRPDPARPDPAWAGAEQAPMGPPPAFSANVLDLLPDSLTPPADDLQGEAEVPAGAQASDAAKRDDTADPPAPGSGAPDRAAAQAQAAPGYAPATAAPQFDRWL